MSDEARYNARDGIEPGRLQTHQEAIVAGSQSHREAGEATQTGTGEKETTAASGLAESVSDWFNWSVSK